MTDIEGRAAMLEIAARYDKLAERAAIQFQVNESSRALPTSN